MPRRSLDRRPEHTPESMKRYTPEHFSSKCPAPAAEFDQTCAGSGQSLVQIRPTSAKCWIHLVEIGGAHDTYSKQLREIGFQLSMSGHLSGDRRGGEKLVATPGAPPGEGFDRHVGSEMSESPPTSGLSQHWQLEIGAQLRSPRQPHQLRDGQSMPCHLCQPDTSGPVEAEAAWGELSAPTTKPQSFAPSAGGPCQGASKRARAQGPQGGRGGGCHDPNMAGAAACAVPKCMLAPSGHDHSPLVRRPNSSPRVVSRRHARPARAEEPWDLRNMISRSAATHAGTPPAFFRSESPDVKREERLGAEFQTPAHLGPDNHNEFKVPGAGGHHTSERTSSALLHTCARLCPAMPPGPTS